MVTTLYMIGQTFKRGSNKEEYMLAQVAFSKCAMVSLRDGNRWEEGVEVDDVFAITEEEFNKICDGDKFELVN